MGPACGAGMMSAPHSLVNVYGKGGLGFGAPWSLAGGRSLQPSWWAWQATPTLAASQMDRTGWVSGTAVV